MDNRLHETEDAVLEKGVQFFRSRTPENLNHLKKAIGAYIAYKNRGEGQTYDAPQNPF